MSAGPPARTDPARTALAAAEGARAAKVVRGANNAKALTALARARMRAIRPLRLRMIDAVTLAAAGLLVLKLIAMSVETPQVGTELPALAQVLAKARAGYELADPATTGSVTPKDETKADAKKPEPPPQAQPPMPEPVSPSERALLEKLGARRDALKQKSDELELREKMLGEAERKLETGLGDLKQAEDKVDTSGKAKAEAEKAGLKNLVTMYETMKPKEAARVFDRLGQDVLVSLVLAMNPRKMAEVLAVMQPDAAEKLTVALANRARGVAGPQAAAGGSLGPNELPAIEPGGR
jgi:flagellar motility protein MotE (MotC chaperone)